MTPLRSICALVVLAALSRAQPEKVIFDTDCAYFNDDGAALVMLLARPRKVDVLGLTVEAGNLWPLQGAEYMFHILRLMGRPDIPLHLGAREPLVHTAAMAKLESQNWGPIEYMGAFAQPEPKSRAGLKPPFGGKFSGLSPARENAVDFLVDTIDRAPGRVTVLELGPMTNLAIALRLRPDIQSKIRRLVFMGGAVHVHNEDSRAAEFNFWFDPEAARIVLRSAIAEKVMFGLDIAYHARLDKSHFDEIAAAKTPVARLFREDLGNRYPGFFKNPDAHTYIWDSLAAGYLLDPSFVTAHEQAYLDVDTRFGANYGAVVPLDQNIAPQATPVEVMLDLDFPKFFALYKQLLTGAR